MAEGTPERTFVAAPDSFKGTHTAAEVADAIASGVSSTGAGADPCPLADGGEGTMEVLLAALGGRRLKAAAHDPLGRPVEAELALIGDGTTALVETAAASGLGLVAAGERDVEAASTFGTGELIAAAVGHGARRVLVAAGGSATTDGGAGALRAIESAGGLGMASLEVLCDVRTPFERAAEMFAPQKGADPDAVRRLTERLHRFAERLPRDPRGVPMTGCAGGLSGGLWAALGAGLRAGAVFVIDAVGFDERMRGAAAVITGEGRLDSQSLEGKVVGEVAARCREAATPVHAIVGTDELGFEPARAAGLASVEAASTLGQIEAAAVEVVREES